MIQFPPSDTQNLEHKHIVGMTQFPPSDTQNPEHKHIVGVIQFPPLRFIKPRS
jgi:hypothetical protein